MPCHEPDANDDLATCPACRNLFPEPPRSRRSHSQICRMRAEDLYIPGVRSEVFVSVRRTMDRRETTWSGGGVLLLLLLLLMGSWEAS